MALYQSAKGWGVDFRDEFGRRHRKHVGTREAAQAIEEILLPQVQATRRAIAKASAQPTLRLSDASQLYLRSRSIAPKTRQLHKWAHEALIRILGDIAATDVTPRLMELFQRTRATQFAPSTLAHECSRIKLLFHYLSERWGIPEGAATLLNSKAPRRSSGITLTHEQENRTLELCSQEKSSLKILLGIDAGLRSGELALLRQNSINPTDHEITVCPSRPGPTRIIPMTPGVARILATYTARRPANPDAPLFPTPKEKQSDPASFLRSLRSKGAPQFRFHDLRHTFASRLAEAGTPEHVIAALLGHAARSTTQLYIHADRRELHQAIAALGKLNEEAQTRTNPPLTGELP